MPGPLLLRFLPSRLPILDGLSQRGYRAYVTEAPGGLTAVEAASIWMQFLTAYFAIFELCKAAPGRNILVPAGTSTAGWAALVALVSGVVMGVILARFGTGWNRR